MLATEVLDCVPITVVLASWDSLESVVKISSFRVFSSSALFSIDWISTSLSIDCVSMSFSIAILLSVWLISFAQTAFKHKNAVKKRQMIKTDLYLILSPYFFILNQSSLIIKLFRHIKFSTKLIQNRLILKKKINRARKYYSASSTASSSSLNNWFNIQSASYSLMSSYPWPTPKNIIGFWIT